MTNDVTNTKTGTVFVQLYIQIVRRGYKDRIEYRELRISELGLLHDNPLVTSISVPVSSVIPLPGIQSK